MKCFVCAQWGKRSAMRPSCGSQGGNLTLSGGGGSVMHFFALALDISQIPLKFAVGASWMRRFMNSPMNFLSASSQGTSRVLQAHAGIPTKPGSPVSKSGILLPTNFLSSAQSLARSLLRVFFLPLPFPCAPRRLRGGVELLVVVEAERCRVGDLDLVRGGVLT